MKKHFITLIILFLFAVNASYSQCAMCKRVAETDMESTHKQSAGRSLNGGILYLLSVPYVIGAVGAFAWYRSRKKEN